MVEEAVQFKSMLTRTPYNTCIELELCDFQVWLLLEFLVCYPCQSSVLITVFSYLSPLPCISNTERTSILIFVRFQGSFVLRGKSNSLLRSRLASLSSFMGINLLNEFSAPTIAFLYF